MYPDVSVSLPESNIDNIFESVNQEFSDALLVSQCDLKDDQDGCHLYFDDWKSSLQCCCGRDLLLTHKTPALGTSL